MELHDFINDMRQRYTMEIVNANCKPRFNHQYALSMLHAKGYRIAVASNSIRNTIEVMMRYAELEGYLDFIISNEDVTKRPSRIRRCTAWRSANCACSRKNA